MVTPAWYSVTMDQPGAPASYSGESVPEMPKVDPAKQKQAQLDQQKSQHQAAAIQKATTQRQQVWQQFLAHKKQTEQQRVQTTIQLKNEAKKIATYSPSSAVLSTTTGGDLSEQTVVQSAMESAREQRIREQKARQNAAKPGAPGKAPSTTKTDDQDSLQRQSEQAMGE